MRHNGQPTVTTGIRMSEDLYRQLAQAAEARGLSMNHLLNQAVREFLARLKPVNEWRMTRDCAGDA